LRAMGYGKNGEFEGKGWEYQTAAKAKEIGLIDNVIEAQLGSAASREMVAEILFRAMLGEMVSYTALNGYVGTGKTLGKEKFGLESVTGVVMANEWANLNTSNVLADGKTQMQLADGTTRTLDISSSLEVVGLTCTAYMADQDKNGTLEVLTDELTADAVNNVADNEGHAVGTGRADEIKDSINALANSNGISINNDTVYYWNYEKSTYTDSDILIRYAVVKGVAAIDEYAAEVEDGDWAGHTVAPRTVTVNGTTYDSWVFTIQPNAVINADDRAIMQRIFWNADRLAYITDSDLALNDYVVGEVYVGTTSTVDVSDTLSWNDFTAKYFVTDNKYYGTWVDNGDSLRVVDNNNDGKAEYVFEVNYTQDKVIGTYKDDPEFYTMQPTKQGFSSIVWGENNNVEDFTVGTIVNYRLIDNKLTVWTAPVVTDSIKTKSFQKITVTTASGDEKGQSGIQNETRLADNIMVMKDEVKYNMYLDQFGFIRTYELAQGNQYALLTEMYGGAVQNSNYISGTTALAEVTIGNETKELTVNNAASCVFLSRQGASDALNIPTAWTMGTGLAVNRYNWLQPAIAHLQGQGNAYGTAGTTTAYYTWNRAVFTVTPVTVNTVASTLPEFDYLKETGKNLAGADVTVDHSFSFTNVASYILKDDGTVDLETASAYAYDKNGNQLYYNTKVLTAAQTNNGVALAAYEGRFTAANWANTGIANKTFAQAMTDGDLAPVYAVDYVQLTKGAIANNQRQYNIDSNYSAKYRTNSNGYVNATVDTKFWIVTPNDIKYVESYRDLPAIKAENIRAAYAVATNTNADSNGADYWIADVIVIETNKIEQDYDSISLFYWNPSETQGQVRYINTLNNEWNAYGSNDYAKVQVVPGGSWGNTPFWGDGYGFYELYNTNFSADTNSLTAGPVNKIVKGEYNDHGIYAGVLRRDAVISNTSGYVSVNMADIKNTIPANDTNVKPVDVGAPGNAYAAPIYHIQPNQYGQTEANEIRLVPATWNNVYDGDELIWVTDAKTNTAFVVDLAVHGNETVTPSWLITWDKDGKANGGIYKDIIDEQNPNTIEGYSIIVKTEGLGNDTIAPQTIEKHLAGWTGTINFTGSTVLEDLYAVDGYRVKTITATTTGSCTVTATSPTTPNNVWTSMGTAQVVVGSALDGDVTITLVYEPAVYTVNLSAAPNTVTNGANITAVTANDNRTPAVAPTDILTSAPTPTLSTIAGREVTVSVTHGALAPFEEFDITVVDGDGSVNYWTNTVSTTVEEIKFTMPADDVTVTVDIVAKDSTVTYKLGDDVVRTATWTISDASSDTYTVVDTLAGYTVNGWAAYKNSATTAFQNNGGGTTIAVADWAENITIVLDATIVEYDLTIVNGYTPTNGDVWVWKATEGEASAIQLATASNANVMKVTVKDTLVFKYSKTDPAQANPSAPAPTAGTDRVNSDPIRPAGDTFTFTVHDIYATTGTAVSITLA
ncbi:MAG: hypothetical protein HDT15_11530, partial [Oscillibacter sp.]|nr:hypothetical protein [Oscillibacter sp.]